MTESSVIPHPNAPTPYDIFIKGFETHTAEMEEAIAERDWDAVDAAMTALEGVLKTYKESTE